MSLHELLSAAIRLPASERGQLVHELLRSLEEPEDVGVDEAWAVELEARAERVSKGESQGRPLGEVVGTLEAKLKR